MMLPLDVNHRQRVFVVKILLCWMFSRIHTCMDSGNNNPKNTLFVSTNNTLTHFPSEKIYLLEEGLQLCFTTMSTNRSQAGCCSSFNCKFEGHLEGDNYSLILNSSTLETQDIVLMRALNLSCMPSTLYYKSGVSYGPPRNQSSFLLNIHNCLNNGIRNTRLSAGLCNKHKCSNIQGNSKTYKVTGVPGNVTCEAFEPEKPTKIPPQLPSLNVCAPVNSNKPEIAANIMKNLSLLLNQLGNHSTATVTMGDIKGVITKLPRKNYTNLKYGILTNGDVKVVNISSDTATNYSVTVQIPTEASEMAVKANSSFAGVMFFPQILSTETSLDFYREVVGIEMEAEIFNLSQNIEIHYSNVDTSGRVATCRSWNGTEEGDWITDGCEKVETNDTITCHCSHLTFFAILLSPPPRNISASDFQSLTYITSIGCGLSLFFLIVALFMHCVLGKGKSQTSQVLINLFVAMSALNLSFLTNESISNLNISGACVAIAAVMHYSLLATFTWFLMQALHLVFNLHRIPTEIKHYLMKICIAGWVTPALVVIILLSLKKYGPLAISTDDGITRTMCWIPDAEIHQGVNIGYYAIVFVFTLSIFVVIIWQFFYYKSNNQNAEGKSSTKSNAFFILSLVFLLGITWAFAFFSYGPITLASYYIFTILNSFQGFLLFIYFYKSTKPVQQESNEESASSATTSSSVIKSPYG
ncbi:adhesion G-protein coupled receptor G5-like [Mugil cephalus]|uniref:adhesion G-protein coupled receptor G5-like n=1 Tax=Mugil cephalus TaxID=48193 RepID=UPI001FB5B34A|nr:adhesion G-protein coupled receptor G5-like [Mugil cephalus]